MRITNNENFHLEKIAVSSIVLKTSYGQFIILNCSDKLPLNDLSCKPFYS